MQETNYIKIQIIKGLNARRLYKSFGVKGLNSSQYSSKLTVCNSLNIPTADSLNDPFKKTNRVVFLFLSAGKQLVCNDAVSYKTSQASN
jgi:hypothetical protein